MRRWQKISFEICCRLPTDRFSIWNTIDKLELRNSVRNKFKEVFTILYTMEYLAESRKANEAKALNSRKGIERSDEICRNRSEIGLNVARRDSIALQRFRNSFVGSTSNFTSGNLAPLFVVSTMIGRDELRNYFHSSNLLKKKFLPIPIIIFYK